ncbi:MAG TPA: hypothetical protein VF572_07165 [Candidatus Saccharimonadales bacterium]|jgi:hypothetical protein
MLNAFFTILYAVIRFFGKKLWRIFQYASRLRTVGSDADQPMISSAELVTSEGLESMARGMMGSYLYNMMVNKAGRVMMLVTLDRNTYMHLIAVGSHSGLDARLDRPGSRKWLEPVSLEGDFPDHFRMYCSKGMQRQTRQVFGPETMASFVDFCRAYNFELFNDTVYVSVAQGAHDIDDSTTMVTDITNFLMHNRKVLDNI